MSRTVSPYGTWRSPLSAAEVASGGVGVYEPSLDGEAAYWLELRPAESGRNVLVRAEPFGPPVDVTPAGFDVRTRVHEYGGGAYVVHDGVAFFSNYVDQRMYRQEGLGRPVAITPEPPTPASMRYGDARVTPGGRLLVCVRERHEDDRVMNELVTLPADGSAEPRIVASGADFFASPRISPDGRRVAYLRWDQPQMPWDGTELHVADLADDGSFATDRHVAGGPRESIVQPSWSADGTLHAVSDRTGWWNICRLRDGAEPENLTPLDAEFGVPMWEFGYASYTFLGDGRIACAYRSAGQHHLAVLDPATRELLDLDVPFTCFDPPYLHAEGTRLLFLAASASMPDQIVSLDFTTRSVEVLRTGRERPLDPSDVAVPEPIEFPTDGGLSAYAYFYPPTNARFEGGAHERPPLIVMSHGGPTGETTPKLDLGIQYFTTRGFAVVDVNYGGSTGYGRAYRERLYGEWGVVDVQDCVNAARFLVERGDADPERLMITGGSAGGYTTIGALAWTDVFAAGASYYGLADLEPFASSTHKFELRYTDILVGPWPEAREKWHERSPIHAFDQISCPVIVFQGLEDEVVPPEQAELMVEALRRNGLPYAYLAFEGEQHGFRKAENIRRSLEAEVSFYAQVLGFELGDPIEPVLVHNLR
jgi:dipeptidyl aminopeptidase/acylaminoacyl peptidase